MCCRAPRECGRNRRWRSSRAASTPLPLVYEMGGGGPDRARIVCGFLGCDERPFNPLLTALPRMIHLPAADRARRPRGSSTLLHAAVSESGHARPRQRERARAAVGADVRRGDPPLSRDAAGRADRLARGAARPGRRAGARRAARRRRRRRGRWSGWRGSSGSRARGSPSGSPRWWASRRCSTSRCGGCSSRRTCWSTAAPSRRSRRRSATSPRRPSAGRSRSWWARRRPCGGAGLQPRGEQTRRLRDVEIGDEQPGLAVGLVRQQRPVRTDHRRRRRRSLAGVVHRREEAGVLRGAAERGFLVKRVRRIRECRGR